MACLQKESRAVVIILVCESPHEFTSGLRLRSLNSVSGLVYGLHCTLNWFSARSISVVEAAMATDRYAIKDTSR
jgi:hypothetical protein